MKKTTDELMDILAKNKNIEQYLSGNTDEFIYTGLSDHLNKLLSEKGLKKSDVVKCSGIDVTYAYQLFSGHKDNPSRDKLIQLALAMQLDLYETQRLLKIGSSGALYPRITRDSIIIHSINSNYTVIECNEILDELGEDTLQ